MTPDSSNEVDGIYTMLLENETQTENETIFYNASDLKFNITIAETEAINLTYIVIPGILIILCIIALIINTRILICVRWLRKPLSPTLYISLSLALADACIAVLLGLGFLLNSLLPIGLNVAVSDYCLLLTIEAFRLSGILISTIHLLALAGSHYLGILSPFKSRRWMTHTNLMVVTTVIWIAPTTCIFGYFSLIKDQGYQIGNCTSQATYYFLTLHHFRTVFSGLFFVPLILMFIIYFHISIIVRKHQASRRWFNRHSRRHDIRGGSRNDQQQQFDRNLKAIWTSLLILSTYMICFMPVVFLYILLCNDCYYETEKVDLNVRIILGSVSNLLLISKPLVNPLIYASRMHEIRAATRKMNADCRRMLCLFVSSDELDRTFSSIGAEGHHPQKYSFVSVNSTKRNQCSASNSIHLGNGFTTRSMRRRTEDITTDL